MGVRPGTRSPHTGTEFKQRSGGELLKTFFDPSIVDLFGWGFFLFVCFICLVLFLQTLKPEVRVEGKMLSPLMRRQQNVMTTCEFPQMNKKKK